MSAQPQCPNAELAVGWALHALEPADEDLLLEHMPDCHICREAVQQTEELFWLLSSTNEQLDPRPGLRDELMAAVAATPQTSPEQREPAWPRASGMPVGSSITVGWHGNSNPPAGPQSVDRLAERRRLVRRRRVAAWGVIVVVAVISVGGLAYKEVQQTHQQQQVQAASPHRTQQILQRVAGPGARYAVLDAPNGEPIAGVRISAGQREVYPYALAPNKKQTSIYVLWGVSKGNPVPVPLGTFDVNSTGESGLSSVGGPAGDDTFNSYAISIEPGRTMPDAPTLVLASGQVAS